MVTAVLKTLQADGLQTAAATTARPESAPHASQRLREHGVQSNAKTLNLIASLTYLASI
jgi:hypothetical protein